jgi:hypothetical protein
MKMNDIENMTRDELVEMNLDLLHMIIKMQEQEKQVSSLTIDEVLTINRNLLQMVIRIQGEKLALQEKELALLGEEREIKNNLSAYH